MQTELVHLEPILLGGFSFYGDPLSVKGGWDEENEIGKTWARFSGFIMSHLDRSYSNNGAKMYEVHIYCAETASKGYFEVFVGEEVNTSSLPISLCGKRIPASDYLKVTLHGNEITGDWWRELGDEITRQAGYRQNPDYIIQVYDERFKGMDRIEESVMEAYIPVDKTAHDDL